MKLRPGDPEEAGMLAQRVRHVAQLAQSWVDPVYEIVGVYFSVVLRDLPPFGIPDWCADLFMNAVTAAVVDV